MRLPGTLSSHILKSFSDGDSSFYTPEEVVLVTDCSYCKKIAPYVEMKPLPVQLVPSCCLHVAPCEVRATILSAGDLQVQEYCDWVPPEPPF